MYNPLNSYAYIHWILDFKYIYIYIYYYYYIFSCLIILNLLPSVVVMTALSGVRLMEEPLCIAAFTDKISYG